MTDERSPSYMLGQCQELGSQIMGELTRAINAGKDSIYFIGHIMDAIAMAKRIRDIHEKSLGETFEKFSTAALEALREEEGKVRE